MVDNNGVMLGITLYKISKETLFLNVLKFLLGMDVFYIERFQENDLTAVISSFFNKGNDFQLCTINSNGSGFKQLTTGGYLGFSWSPDGKIVYVNHDWGRIDETKGTLWKMAADRSYKQQLTNHRATVFQ